VKAREQERKREREREREQEQRTRNLEFRIWSPDSYREEIGSSVARSGKPLCAAPIRAVLLWSYFAYLAFLRLVDTLKTKARATIRRESSNPQKRTMRKKTRNKEIQENIGRSLVSKCA
jgi:hypothetical protein